MTMTYLPVECLSSRSNSMKLMLPVQGSLHMTMPSKDGRHGFSMLHHLNQLPSYTHPGYGCRPLHTYKTCDPKECSANSLCNLEGHPAPKCPHAFNNFQISDYSDLQAHYHNINGVNCWAFVAVTHECDFIGSSLPVSSHFTITTIVFMPPVAGASNVICSEEQLDEYMGIPSLPIDTHMYFSFSSYRTAVLLITFF
jgi:hypothetical protein